ncbi:divalent anion:Na+ symporter (DASS) family transporter [Superficieibacter electus]|uniref:Divalent anion:Na+ symporter (DASS) family transporter n=1 Tax=Superficieibacter electus TaxID=2022662 RepID=A0A2P5GJP3_9ENTR|nr:SLC13 family permease [Superficieibacter electus]POP41897.1 divalent anion:Na+ symporter (DASS) family transporter [Superficieibacter electus]POP44204.1 divalent anion:Na+ symporter (DASS) family transporter [Superficieibacter electus]
MNNSQRFIVILSGPSIFAVSALLFSSSLTLSGAQSVGVLLWMILWWVTRPVHVAVTSLLPIVMNALFNIIPMEGITRQYFSDSIILILGSGLLCLPWASVGLDRRVALKVLSLIGPSMKSQVTVWFLASIITSTIFPNVMVCALFTPIAVAMLTASGYKDIPSCKPAVPILLAIGWGGGIGGVGSPLGGAMNLAAISILESKIGHEFMYVDWLIRLLPFFVLISLVSLGCMLLMPMQVKRLDGTRAWFQQQYRQLGPMTRDEKICAVLFLTGLLGAFTRPLYAATLPALSPAYLYLILGGLCFVLTSAKNGPLLTWERAEKETMWGMLLLFGGGLALGNMVNDSGASAGIASLITHLSLDGGLLTLVVFTLLARLLSETTNSTASAAVVLPIVLGFTSKLGLNPIPYWFITVMAFNAEFMLPISIRAIPVAYGLDARKMFKGGLVMAIVHMVMVVAVGYACLKWWHVFSYLTDYAK